MLIMDMSTRSTTFGRIRVVPFIISWATYMPKLGKCTQYHALDTVTDQPVSSATINTSSRVPIADLDLEDLKE
jgi:hypothetical protein